VAEAHKRDLQVHVWNVRDEHLWWTESATDENMFYFDAGVDGMLSEHTHLTMSVFKDEIEPKSSRNFIM
jgi:glycerophosphoryl diester phosphodiesterase